MNAPVEAAKQYHREDVVGHGTFASVFRGRQVATNRPVAIKKLSAPLASGNDAESLREVRMLRMLCHENIIELLDVYVDKGHVCLVMPLCVWDLDQVITHPETRLHEGDMKRYMSSILNALEVIHSQGVVHRDIKANNVLVSSDGVVKLADLGSANQAKPEGGATVQVATRWNRPPDVLYGNGAYQGDLDMWGLGCLLCEMVKRSIPFEGSSDIDQLCKIFAVLGSPTDETWPDRASLPCYMPLRAQAGVPLGEFLACDKRNVSSELVTLAQGLLKCDPKQRLTAKQALQSTWFQCEPSSTMGQDLAEPTGPSSVCSEAGQYTSSSSSSWGTQPPIQEIDAISRGTGAATNANHTEPKIGRQLNF